MLEAREVKYLTLTWLGKGSMGEEPAFDELHGSFLKEGESVYLTFTIGYKLC